MNLTYLLLLHAYPSPHPEDPKPEGGERETADDDDDDDEPDTIRNAPPPATTLEPFNPDADPIDLRVLNGDRDHG